MPLVHHKPVLARMPDEHHPRFNTPTASKRALVSTHATQGWHANARGVSMSAAQSPRPARTPMPPASTEQPPDCTHPGLNDSTALEQDYTKHLPANVIP